MTPVKSPKKLIEVALPLDAINAEASLRKRKAPGGYPTTLHKWWAQRPVAAARAVVFAQMVNDPGGERGYFAGMTKAQAQAKREELFSIIEDLVRWENTNNESVLARARAAIRESWAETCRMNKAHPLAAELFDINRPPAFHDPFAGSGALPLEAQRLGLESWASDLNPVAVAINKAMIEIPPSFVGRLPVGPRLEADRQANFGEDWGGARGLAEDVRRYGAWVRAEALERIGNLYPEVEVTAEMLHKRPDLKPYLGEKLTVVAWLWARTVKSPNPAFSDVQVPLASTFELSSKQGKQAYVYPVIENDGYRFVVRVGAPDSATKAGTKMSRGSFRCLMSDTPIKYEYIDEEANAGRMGARLMAIVAEGKKGRVYLSPLDQHEIVAASAAPIWKSETLSRGTFASNAQGRVYGFRTFGDYFSARQLVALNTFSELVQLAVSRCRKDALAAGMADDFLGLDAGGCGATAYAEAVGVYLAFAVSRLADYGCSIATWRPKDNAMRSGMPKQAIQMTWDFAEGSPFASSSSGFSECVQVVSKVVQVALNNATPGHAFQASAAGNLFPEGVANAVISTDPPYFDNIGYADLSDFLYVWLRRALKPIFPSVFSTVASPKDEELVASTYRHGSRQAAEAFFLTGMSAALRSIALRSHPAIPVTIYYAFKQSETTDEQGTSSSGWETFLQAVLDAGFVITGTWPIRTEGDNRQVGVGSNALASSIVLVCRQRAPDAPSIGRRALLRELNAALPEALDEMTRGGVNSPVAAVDLSQAIIGPGMAIFSQYSAVLEADGSRMSVKTALQLINRFMAEDDFDHDTQFCLAWFEHRGWQSGKFGDADVLARAKGTSVDGLRSSGVVDSSGGELRLLRWAEMPTDWSPETDARTPIWEALHQLIGALSKGGESAAGVLLARMPARAEPIRALAYRLYTLCERLGQAEDARSYNELIGAWSGIESAAQDAGPVGTQTSFDL